MNLNKGALSWQLNVRASTVVRYCRPLVQKYSGMQYRNHFARLGATEGTVGVAAADRDGAREALSGYAALDVVVVRGLASANLDAMTALVEAAAPD